MASRQKRDVRITTLHTFYNVWKQKALAEDDEENLEIAKKNVEFSNCFLYESEVEKFAEQYPQVDMEEFTAFLQATSAIKEKKSSSGSGQGRGTHLNTEEAAIERGVLPESVGQYITLVSEIYEKCKEINDLLGKTEEGNARCSFAIPRKKSIDQSGAYTIDESASA